MTPLTRNLAPGLKEIKSLINTAQGKEKADLVIKGGNLVNVYTVEVQKDISVAIKGKRVAYVGKNIEPLIGPRTRIIDAHNKFVTPGFIDGHNHIMNYWTAENFLRSAIPTGTTAVITETMEMNFSAGYKGALEFIKSLEDQPVKIFATLSPMVSISKHARERVFEPALFRKLLRRSSVIGMGETYWLPAVQGDESILQLFDLTLKSGKKIEGHTAGARDGKLQAYVAAGNFADHEPINVEETLERLRMGIYVMIREGDIRQDLAEIARIKQLGVKLRFLSFCSDGVNPVDILEKGYMETVVRKAIEVGFEPVQALQMASLNAAQHFGLDNFMGGIAPGKLADIILMPDLKQIKVEMVISNGRIIAKDGKALVEPRSYRYPDWLRRTYSLSRPILPQDLELKINGNRNRVRVRAVQYITSLVTKESILDLPVHNGKLDSQPENDILKVSVIDNKDGPEKRFTGLLTGYGLKKGALATGSSWDIFAITVTGVNDSDMAMAANRVAEIQGGTVLVEDGKIVAEFALPIGNAITEESPLNIAEKMAKMQKELEARGVKWPDGHLTLSTLSTPAIPHIRMSEEGLFSIRDSSIIPFIAD